MKLLNKKIKTKKKRILKLKLSKKSNQKNLFGGALFSDILSENFNTRLDFFNKFPYSSRAKEIIQVVNDLYLETYSSKIENKFIGKVKAGAQPKSVTRPHMNGKIIEFTLYQNFNETTVDADSSAAGGPSAGGAGGTKNTEAIFNKNFEDYKNFFNKPGEGASVEIDDDLMIRDTSITVCNMHGGISPDSTKYTGVVPENNILCFVSPINYVLEIDFLKQYNLASEFNNMSYKLYKEIFIHHGNIRNAGFGDLKPAEKFPKSYACLVDCMCYYPGQVFPNLNLTLSNQDDYEGKSPLDGIQYLCLKKNDTKKTLFQ